MSGHAGGGRGRRRGGGHEEEHVNHERWLVSYSDMITVLMALFIVLFAISQVDQEKYIALRESLSAGFADMGSPSVLDGTTGTLDGESMAQANPAPGTAGMVDADLGLGEQGANPQVAQTQAQVDAATMAAAQAEASHLQEIRDQIATMLAQSGLDGAVRFRIDDRGLVMGLVADDVFFAPESADLTDTARQVLDVAAPTMRAISEEISVEGHANTLPVSGRYATNWELSADRATQVLRHLVERAGMPANRIRSVGYGDTRPLVAGTDEAAMTQNRRVDLVILSSAPDTVRALIPSIANGTEQ